MGAKRQPFGPQSQFPVLVHAAGIQCAALRCVRQPASVMSALSHVLTLLFLCVSFAHTCAVQMNLLVRLAPLLTTCCLLVTFGQTLLIYEDASLLAPRLTDSLALFL